MVVNDASGHIITQSLQRRKTLSVHQDDPIDGPVRQILGLGEGQLIPVERQEPAEIPVGPAGQYRYRIGIELGSPKQGGQPIEVGVLVSQDDDQMTPTSLPITAKVSSTRSSCSSVCVAM